jgi:molecular chaperone GrpE
MNLHPDSLIPPAPASTPDAGNPPPEPPTAPPGPEEALAAKTEEVKRLQDRLLRLQAEYENFKKRTARERVEFLKFSNESLLLEVLPVLDNLDRALASARAEASFASLVSGVEMIVRLFRSTLEKYGVKPMEAVGQPFDPSLHQAVAQLKSSDGLENHVVDEIQKGYFLEGRVLRAAMVRVSRAGSADPGDGPTREDGQA